MSPLDRYEMEKNGDSLPRGPRKAAMVTRWISGSSPVRYLRNSVTLFSRAANWLCFSSSRLLARASSPVLLPLNLLRRLRRRRFLMIWGMHLAYGSSHDLDNADT